MTTEEKAKAYDDVLEKAKAHINIKGIGDTVDLCKHLFPQLCDSEDEKIRKEINTLYSEIDTCISELLKARTDKDSEAEGKALFKMEGLMVATLQDLSCIEDYLEKQKESLHIPETCKENADSFTDEDERIRKSLIEIVERFMDGERKEKTLAFLEKQKEQKPTDRFEEAREKYQVEWSKDDEAAYDAFMCEVVNEKMNPTIEQVKWLRNIRDRLKSLRLQPKHEWSDEDEEKLKAICTYLRDYPRLAKLGDKLRFNEYCDFLKSLRPSWKPSEEQMEALEECGECKRCIKELYEQLKKLM